jgi:hypothetical protein
MSWIKERVYAKVPYLKKCHIQNNMCVKSLSIQAKLLPVEDIGSFALLQGKKFQSEHRSMILHSGKIKTF